MALELKKNLFIEIFNPNLKDKYSKSLLNLKTIIDLEKSENFKIPQFIEEKLKIIFNKENNFINDIPLSIIEYYFNKKIDNLNSYVNIQYKDFELNIKANELYLLLEKYYSDIFLVSSQLAIYYNLEIKIKDENENSTFA